MRTHITVRMSENEQEQIKRVAGSYDLNVSEFIRRMTDWVEQTQPRLIIEPVRKRNGEKEPA